MKRVFALPMLVCLAMVCSCQKQDSTADQQLAERKAQLDAREKALDSREKALDARERVTTDTRAAAGLQSLPPDAQSQLKSLIPDAAHVKAERQRRLQERIAQRQHKLEEIQRSRLPDTGGSPDSAATSSAGTTSGTEDLSPSPSPTPQ